MGARCGIQNPIEIKNLFASAVVQTGRREEVMDQWIAQKLGRGPANTKCDGRVLRRLVNQSGYYRYQCQEASDTAEFGFSKNSIKEDIQKACTVVVFKQTEANSKAYNYWTWEWKVSNGILRAEGSSGEALRTFEKWADDKMDRAVVSVTWDAEGTVRLP